MKNWPLTSLPQGPHLIGTGSSPNEGSGLASVGTPSPILVARSLEGQARLRAAIAVLQQSAASAPAGPDVLHYLARLQTLVGDHEEAIAAYRAVIASDPGDTAAWILVAQLYRTLGRRTQAVDAFRQALARDPANGAAWWALANYFPGEIGEGDIAQIRAALDQHGDNPHEAGPLHIALGVIADARGQQAEAFTEISEGKRLRAMVANYNPDWVTREVDRTIEALPSDRIATCDNSPRAQSGPIFVVGMPRAGTTLLERVLSGHPAIEPTGELPLINGVVERVRQHAAGRDFHSVLASLSPDQLAELGQWYLDRAGDYRRSDRPFFIDKWNSNWLHAGLIRLILPGAPIVDLRRNALDCCWSNFKMLLGSGLGFSNDLTFLGRFYRDYVRLMDWARSVAPGRVHRLRYEEMVDDLEGSTRTLLDFLGLPFDPACIDFHRSSAPVATPSSEQVRRPINRDAIGSAEAYRPWLAPLIAELGPLADA